jgi:hypothetical protein
MQVLRSLPRILLAVALPAACAQRAGRAEDSPPPAPPRAIAPPLPPLVEIHDPPVALVVCVLENGALKLVRADYDTRTGDSEFQTYQWDLVTGGVRG